MTTAARVLVTGVNGQLGHALQASVERWKPVDADVAFVGRDAMDLANPDDVRRTLDAIAPVVAVTLIALAPMLLGLGARRRR